MMGTHDRDGAMRQKRRKGNLKEGLSFLRWWRWSCVIREEKENQCSMSSRSNCLAIVKGSVTSSSVHTTKKEKRKKKRRRKTNKIIKGANEYKYVT